MILLWFLRWWYAIKVFVMWRSWIVSWIPSDSFPHTIGVFRHVTGCLYMSRQRVEPNIVTSICSINTITLVLRHLLRKRNIMDFDLLFTRFPEPF